MEQRGNSHVDRKCVFLEEWTPYCNQFFLTHVQETHMVLQYAQLFRWAYVQVMKTIVQKGNYMKFFSYVMYYTAETLKDNIVFNLSMQHPSRLCSVWYFAQICVLPCSMLLCLKVATFKYRGEALQFLQTTTHYLINSHPTHSSQMPLNTTLSQGSIVRMQNNVIFIILCSRWQQLTGDQDSWPPKEGRG